MESIKRVRDNLKNAYIISEYNPFIWYKPKRYLAACIRYFRGSKWSHSAILEEYENGDLYVVEMLGSGITRSKFDAKWCGDSIIKVHEPINKFNNYKLKMVIELLTLLRLKYDYRGTLWYQLLFSLQSFFNRKFNTSTRWLGFTNAGKASERFYCSELVTFIYNFTSHLYSDWYMIAPDMLDNHKDTTKFFKVIYEGSAKDFTIKQK